MISKIELKFGRDPGSSTASIDAAPVTVFVGPNNSGKSKILEEIVKFCTTGISDPGSKILKEINFTGLPESKIQNFVDSVQKVPNKNEIEDGENIFVGGKFGRIKVSLDRLRKALNDPGQNIREYCNLFLKHSLLVLDGRSRIDLINQQPAGDLQDGATQSLQVLFRSSIKRCEVRRIVHSALGLYFVVDPTALGSLRIRLSASAPIDEIQECGIHNDAVRFHSEATLIDETSDGVKAFTGIITEVIAGDPKLLLIDEPEAFLHPALATKLGFELSRAALTSEKRLFVSTHSPAFVMGCIQSGAPVNIVRLTYRAATATARLLPSKDLLKLMRNPLLRSTGVLTGLFYEFIVITESDADRAFYQEINERLLMFDSDFGIRNCLFINAQNKQTVHTIVRPLRQLGIPAAGIVDIDVLKEGGSVWSNLLSSCNIPEISRNSMAISRSDIKSAMDATGRDMKRDGGLRILDPTRCEAAMNLFGQLAEYGIFVVPGGELESWLTQLGATGHGPAWLISIFEKMGEDPDDADYLRPSSGDVWAFVRNLKKWLVDSTRKGIPS